jgi:hypothetical protein
VNPSDSSSDSSSGSSSCSSSGSSSGSSTDGEQNSGGEVVDPPQEEEVDILGVSDDED